MKKHPKSFCFVCATILVMVLSSLACSIDLGSSSNDEINAEQTLAALQQTQTALDNLISEEIEEEVSPQTEEEPPAEETEEAEAAEEEEPAEEQELPDVVYEGISFSFDESIGINALPATIPMQDMGEEYMPGETYPTHYEFTFGTYAVGEHFHTPMIIVYPVDEYLAISSYVSDSFDSLQQALATQPSGGVNDALPFLPMWNAGQMFSAKVDYFDFQNGSGVRYLTMYGQATYPVDNSNLFYTYQGMTDDGRFYISAVMPVTHTGLPADGDTIVDDWETFYNEWDTYITETVDWLNAQDPSSFFPSLTVLDEMMASFLINR